MKRFLYKILVWGLSVFIGLNFIAYLSLYFLGNSFLYKPQYLQNGIKENKFDYLILGSSIGLTTLNTNLIDSLTGRRGLNMSMDDTSMGTHYLMLQHYYALGKKTDFVVLTISPGDAQNNMPKISNNDCRFISYVSDDYVYNYYNTMEEGLFKPLTLSAYFPLTGVSYYNVEVFFPSFLTVFQPRKKNRFDSHGNYSYPINKNELKEKEMKSYKIFFSNPYYKKIVTLCSQNQSKLVIYLAPIYRQKVALSIVEKNVINHSDFLYDSKWFCDDNHLNYLGRTEATIEFAKEIDILFNNEKK